MLCPNCGTILPDDSRFCTECGAALNAAATNAPVYTADPLSFSVPDVPPVIEPVAPFTGLESDAPDDTEESAPRAASEPDDTASDDPFAAFNAAAAASGLVAEAPPPYTAPSPEPYEPRVPDLDASREPSSNAAPASGEYTAPAAGGYSVPGGGYSAPLPPASGKKKSGKAGVIIILVVIVAVIAAAAAIFTARRAPTESRPQATIVQSGNSGSLTDQFRIHGQDGQEQDSDSETGLRGAFLPGGSK